MTHYDTHLCLVSAQATPNLLPVLDDAWRPRRVVLACSAQMKDAAQTLRSVIQTKGWRHCRGPAGPAQCL